MRKIKKEIEYKSEKNVDSLKSTLSAMQSEINELDVDLNALDKDLEVLKTEQTHNTKDFQEIKESYKELARNMENIVQKMIEFLATE